MPEILSGGRREILRALAEAYSMSHAGRTGRGAMDFQIDFRDLLRTADAADGERRELALTDLAEAEAAGLIVLERHRRDQTLILKVRVPLEREGDFFRFIKIPSPSERRQEFANQFEHAIAFDVPQRWAESWHSFCSDSVLAALSGQSIAGFVRDEKELNGELLSLVPKLLGWNGESMLRFASCVLCGHSKRLEQLAIKLQSILSAATKGEIQTLEDLGIIENPRFVLLHGPTILRFAAHEVDFGLLSGPVRVSGIDISSAVAIETASARVLTVENETVFHELAKLRSGKLLIHTTYPGSATLELLQRLPKDLEFWHFGDSDPNGFEILYDLRRRTGRTFRALLMDFRSNPASEALSTSEVRLLQRLLCAPEMHAEYESLRAMIQAGHKGNFEQESLGRPNLPDWPYYSDPLNSFRLS